MQSILVYATSWIGDAVMSLGAIRALKGAYPDAKLTLLVRPWVQELYAGCEAVDATLVYDPQDEHKGLGGFRRASRAIRADNFDACVLFPNAFRAAALGWAAGVPERWGYATESRGFLLTRRVPPAARPFGRHQAYYYLDLLAGLGLHVDVSWPDTHLNLPDLFRDQARELLQSAGWTGAPLVGVHPGATNSRAKLWKPERYGTVAARLAASHDAQVVLLGGPKEAKLVESVAVSLGEASESRPLMLGGKTSLGELMGVLGVLSVFLTNDSGPMHVAAALGVPTVAVFGPTDERETGPRSEHAAVVRENVDCSPCLLRDCPIDHRCMDRVTVDDVYEKAVSLL